MSKEALKWYGDQKVADTGLKSVLFALSYAANKGTGECIIAQGEIAERTGMTERSVRTSLVLLGRLEMIKRTPRSNGRYGRVTDLITLSLDRNFDLSRVVIRAVRRAAKPVPTKISNRKIFPLQPENSSGLYNQGYQESLSCKDLALTVDVEDTHEASSFDRTRSDSKVVFLKLRGEA